MTRSLSCKSCEAPLTVSASGYCSNECEIGALTAYIADQERENRDLRELVRALAASLQETKAVADSRYNALGANDIEIPAYPDNWGVRAMELLQHTAEALK